MSDPLKSQIQEDMKSAMRAKDKERLSVIRMLIAAIKQIEIDDRTELDDVAVLTVLNKMIKQRRDAAQQFKDGNRPDLADKENLEIKVLQEYLPPQLDESEVATIVQAAITESGATSIKDMGKVMGILKPKLQGRTDLGAVSVMIKSLLGQD